MKKTFSIAAIILCLTLPSFAITGLGFGIHGGMTSSYSYDALDENLDSVATLLGITDELTFDEQMMLIGAHVKIGTLPIIDFNFFADYAWASKEISSALKFKLHDFSIGVSAKKMFGATLAKPYVGAGAAMHALAYEFDTDLIQTFPIPDNQSKLGFHFLGGVELDIPVFPLTPYAEGQYNIITTTGNSTKYLQISAGLTMNF